MHMHKYICFNERDSVCIMRANLIHRDRRAPSRGEHAQQLLVLRRLHIRYQHVRVAQTVALVAAGAVTERLWGADLPIEGVWKRVMGEVRGYECME